MKISVVMASYNGQKFILDQLNSILQQTILPDEVIVVDDSSSDKTCWLVECFKETSPFSVKLIKNKENMGSTFSFAMALAEARGDIVFFSDQDDVWESDKIECFVKAFQDNPSVDLFFSDADLVDENLKELDKTLWIKIGMDKELRTKLQNQNSFITLLRRSWVTGATMAIRSRLAKVVQPIPRSWVHDAWIASIAASVSRIGIIERSLIKYRQHPQQQIGVTKEFGIFQRLEAARSENLQRRMIEHENFVLIHDRLTNIDFENKPAVMEYLRHKISFSVERVKFAKLNKTVKVGGIVKNLLRQKYHLYCSGFKSFLIDLLS